MVLALGLATGGCEDDVTTVLVPVEVPVTAADLSVLTISDGTLSPDFSRKILTGEPVRNSVP